MSPQRSTRVTVRRRPRWRLASTAGRIRVLLVVVAVMFSVTGARAIQFQVLDASDMASEALANMKVTRDIPAVRGQILDRDGRVLAFSEDTVNITASPNTIAGRGVPFSRASAKDKELGAAIPDVLAPVIARCTSQPVDQVRAKLVEAGGDGVPKQYVRVATQVGVDAYNCIVADQGLIDARADFGVSLTTLVSKEPAPTRVYPMNTVASNTIGFLSGGKGGAGLELSQDALLRGTPGEEAYDTSRNGKIPLAESTLTPAIHGTSITTTIDSGMCWQTQQLIDRQRSDRSLAWGFSVVLEVKTGKLLCLATTPSFDGNNAAAIAKSDPSALGNPAMTAPYEPGSTMKLLTLATVLDAGGATPDSLTHVTSTAEGIKSADHTIRDADRHGAVDYTTRGILVNSSNQGVIQLARSTFSDKGEAGKQEYIDYMHAFGLGQKTNIGLPGENPGVFPADKILGDSYTMDSVAFGTSLSVNAVEMASAVNAVANGGMYVAPSLVAATTAPDGAVTPSPASTTRRVIKKSTSSDLLGMMENRVLDSYDRIGIPGVRTGAKTGTARMGKSNLITSIVGVAPIEDPQVLVYTVFFQRGSQIGAGLGTAGPVYKDIMSLAIQRYGILPNAAASKYCQMQPLERGQQPTKKC